MKQFSALLFFALLSFANAQSPKVLVPEDCNATEFQAGLVLEEINKDRDEGYILSLFRVVDAHSQPEGPGNIFYLTIDVLETECSVLSGKSWKECEIRPSRETVFGQCKAVLYLSLPWRRVKLYSYNCTLSTVPPRLEPFPCLGCRNLEKDTASFVERAEEMIDKYNSRSNNSNAFKLDVVERALTQSVNGMNYFTEFTIRETNCSRLQANASDCQFLEDGQARVGFCKGTKYVVWGGDQPEHDVAVSCDIYEIKQEPGQPHKGHGHRHHHKHGDGHGHGHGHGHRHGKSHRHHHHHHPDGQNQTRSEERKHHHKEKHGGKHGDKHGNKRGHGPPNGHPQKPHGSSSEEHTHLKPTPPPLAGPVGSVQIVHLENEGDVFPVPSIPDPSPGSTPLGPGVFGPFRDPEPQPFPLVPSTSKGCPSDPKHDLPHIVPLLPVPK